MLTAATRLAYYSQHLSLLIPATVLEEAARLVSRTPRPHISLSVLREVQRRRRELHRRDLANVEAGLYPREMLFDIPVGRYLRELPRLIRDAPSVMRRKRENAYTDIPKDID